jgi:hypothetical protein
MKAWFLYGLVILQLLWGLFLWALSLVGLAPSYVNTYTGITSPINYTWYFLAGAVLSLIIMLASWWGWSWFDPKDKSTTKHRRMYFQIGRASAGFFLIYAALFCFIGIGVNWVSDYSTITLVRISNPGAIITPLLLEYFIVWMVSLGVVILFTTYIVYWSVYLFFFGNDTGINATATRVTKGINNKANK